MIIDDEKDNQMNKMASTLFDINRISPEFDSNYNLLNNQDSKESHIDGIENKVISSLEKDTNNFGQKRTFQQFSSQAKLENNIIKNTNNNKDFNISANSNFKHFSYSCNNLNNSLNKNIIGLSNNENPFISKTPTPSIIGSLLYNKQTNINQLNDFTKETPGIPENHNDESKNIQQSKKTIPFLNNFNSSLGINSNSLENSIPSFTFATPRIYQNIPLNINLNSQNPLNNDFPYNQNSNQTCLSQQPNLIANFGAYNNSYLGIRPSNNEEKESFSKAIINNRIYTEDTNDFIQCGQQQSKRPNYRVGLFDKGENSSSHILKSNFSKNSVNQKTAIPYYYDKDEGSEGEDNGNKENTDDDQEEIRIVDETLQRYMDEDKVINDKKLKISVIRKVAPYYKVLTQPNNDQHFLDTVSKIKTIINEDKSDIMILLNYEYLKNLREKVFQKFCKMINKFFFKLNENKVKEFGGENYNLEIPETLKERLKNIYTKINDYFDKNRELE